MQYALLSLWEAVSTNENVVNRRAVELFLRASGYSSTPRICEDVVCTALLASRSEVGIHINLHTT